MGTHSCLARCESRHAFSVRVRPAHRHVGQASVVAMVAAVAEPALTPLAQASAASVPGPFPGTRSMLRAAATVWTQVISWLLLRFAHFWGPVAHPGALGG